MIDLKKTLKKIETTIDNLDYISKVENIVGKVKNIVLEVEICKFKVLEYKDYAILILKLKDNTDYISAWVIVNRDKDFADVLKMLNTNGTKYYVKGDVSIIDIEDKEFKEEMRIMLDNYSIDEDYISEKSLVIKAIEIRK